jgi:CheY-like chemotaxis protein
MGKGETVLIVDDLPEQTVLARRILQRSEYVALTAHSAAEALLTLEQLDGALDLLITDLRMPGMHGSELARQVRSLYPLVKILFVSGGSLETVSEDGFSILPQPYAPGVLLERVRLVLEGKG